MQIVLDTEARADYVRYRPVTCLDAKTREKAENIFEDYRSRGVITGSYSDDAWQATNFHPLCKSGNGENRGLWKHRLRLLSDH